MARFKKGNWSPKEISDLLKIKTGKNRDKQLEEFSRENNRKLSTVKAQWYAQNAKPKVKSPVSDHEPMKFVIDKSILEPRKADSVDIARMKAGLGMVVPKLEPRSGNIAIPTKLKGAAKNYLKETLPERVFVFSDVVEKGVKTGNTRIFRKS